MGPTDRIHLNYDGIFLGYDENTPLRNEGLGRLLALLVDGWVERKDCRLAIACPYWLVGELEAILQDQNVPRSEYDIISTRKPWKRWFREKCSRSHAKQWKYITVFAVGCLLFFLWPISGILLVPSLIAYLLHRLYRRRTSSNSIAVHKRALRKARRKSREYSREIRKLVRVINAQKKVQNWLVPTPFWPESLEISHFNRTVCPDLVLHDLPLKFSDPGAERIYLRILSTLQETPYAITYSETTKKNHLVEGVGFSPDQVVVIPHGKVELNSFLKLSSKDATPEDRYEIALDILNQYQIAHLWNNPYWRFCDWSKTKYILYASQHRSQKNILSLIFAISNLAGASSPPIRLVLTCNREPGSELDRIVREMKLEPWVLFTPQLSSEVLAAMYCCAQLSVNPTLSEGGFPFTFSEAYSVGTPSLLSNIEVVREYVREPHLRSKMLFDPMDRLDLSKKILWGTKNRDELLRLQKPLYDAMPSWKDVAEKYSFAIRQG